MANLKPYADIWRHPVDGWTVTVYHPNGYIHPIGSTHHASIRHARKRAANLLATEVVGQVNAYTAGTRQRVQMFTKAEEL